MTRLDEAVHARLQELRDVARSGVTERTGRGSGRRIKGMRSSYPELRHLPAADTPKIIASAIERGRGKVYRRIVAAVRQELSRYIPESKKRIEKPTVPAHRKLSRKCKVCGVMHGKGAHRFHGEGSFHKTHLFAFNPPIRIKNCAIANQEHQKSRRQYAHVGHYKNTICVAGAFKNLPKAYKRGILAHEMGHVYLERKPRHTEKEADAVYGVKRRDLGTRKNLEYLKNPTGKRPVKIYGNVERIYLSKGHYDLRRKPKMYGLPGGELWITWGRAGAPNATGGRPLGNVRRIDAQKTQKHRCDPGCKELGHRYYHPFKEPNEAWILRDGSILIRAK